jgi:hypothetical protein
MGSITLHPKLGVNPRLTFCPQCGKEGTGLVMLGIRNCKTECPECHTVNYGSRPGDRCGHCNQQMFGGKQEELGEFEKLPGELCDECKAEREEFAKIVAEGGVYWKCKQCALRGVLKPTAPLAALVREKLNMPAPKPCGIEFEKCEEHAAGEEKK